MSNVSVTRPRPEFARHTPAPVHEVEVLRGAEVIETLSLTGDLSAAMGKAADHVRGMSRFDTTAWPAVVYQIRCHGAVVPVDCRRAVA